MEAVGILIVILERNDGGLDSSQHLVEVKDVDIIICMFHIGLIEFSVAL